MDESRKQRWFQQIGQWALGFRPVFTRTMLLELERASEEHQKELKAATKKAQGLLRTRILDLREVHREEMKKEKDNTNEVLGRFVTVGAEEIPLGGESSNLMFNMRMSVDAREFPGLFSRLDTIERAMVADRFAHYVGHQFRCVVVVGSDSKEL